MADSDPIQPRVIWLSLHCVGCSRHVRGVEDGQLWCTDPQDDCPECGLGWTRYRVDEEQAATVHATHPPEEPGA